MRALWDWFIACLPNWLIGGGFKGGIQGDDDPDGWQAPVDDNDPGGEK